MRILVAIDSFAGTLDALEAGEAVADGLRDEVPRAVLEVVPMSDGGPGFLTALSSSLDGGLRETRASDPFGRPVTAPVLVSRASSYLESADCCGLHLLDPSERDPLRSSSGGLGGVLATLLSDGVRRVVVGLGGSATNDGGAGMLVALGARLTDSRGGLLDGSPHSLLGLEKVSLPSLGPLRLVAAVDVESPLLGPEGASHLFGRQKGAGPKEQETLELALARFAEVCQRDIPGATGLELLAGSGAAGGLGYGLALLGAKLIPGAEMVAGALGLAEKVARADLVITGEGSFDTQTLRGKVVSLVASLCKTAGVPCLVLAGQVLLDAATCRQAGVSACYSLVCEAGSEKEAMAHAAATLRRVAARAIREHGRDARSVGGVGSLRTKGAPMSEHDGPFDEPIVPAGPEADLQEQRDVVEERQRFDAGERPIDVDEADWVEQSISELDDEDH